MKKISRKLFLKKAAAGLAALAVSPALLSCDESDAGSRKIRKLAPLAGRYDVVIAGGGPAGFIAAIAAARQGAKTAIVERYGFFGGMATIGYVAPISVFALKNELVIGGIPWEFVKRLESMGGAFIEWPKANIDFDVELYKLCCQRMIREAGVDMYMHSAMIGCEMEGKRIETVIIENKNGLETLASKVFIDCTGDGDLAHMADVPMQPNPDGEPATLLVLFHPFGSRHRERIAEQVHVPQRHQRTEPVQTRTRKTAGHEGGRSRSARFRRPVVQQCHAQRQRGREHHTQGGRCHGQP